MMPTKGYRIDADGVVIDRYDLPRDNDFPALGPGEAFVSDPDLAKADPGDVVTVGDGLIATVARPPYLAVERTGPMQLTVRAGGYALRTGDGAFDVYALPLDDAIDLTADAAYDKRVELRVLGTAAGATAVWVVEELLDGIQKVEPAVPAGYKLLGPLRAFTIPKGADDLGAA